MFEPTARLGRIAILWRGDEAARRTASPETSRFKAVFTALAEVGLDAEPVVYEAAAWMQTGPACMAWPPPLH